MKFENNFSSVKRAKVGFILIFLNELLVNQHYVWVIILRFKYCQWNEKYPKISLWKLMVAYMDQMGKILHENVMQINSDAAI